MAPNFIANLTVIVVCYITIGGCDAFSFISFTKDTICDTESRLVHKCMAKKEGVYRTQTDCAYKCLQDNNCVGVSTGQGSACFHHFTCPGKFQCGVGIDMSVYWRESTALTAAMTISTAGPGATSTLTSQTTTVVSTAAEPVTTTLTTTNETTAETTLPPPTTTATTPVPTTTTATTPAPTTTTTTLPPKTTTTATNPVSTTTAATTPAPTTTTTTLPPTTTTTATNPVPTTTAATTPAPTTTTLPPTTTTTATTPVPTTTAAPTTTTTLPPTTTTTTTLPPTTTTTTTLPPTTTTTTTLPPTTTTTTTLPPTTTTTTTLSPTTTTTTTLPPTTTTTTTLPPTTTTTLPPTTTTTTTLQPTTTTTTTLPPTTTTTTTLPPTTTTTATTLPTTTKVAKTCKNNGNWSSTEFRCVCNSGWVGDTCERRAKGCQDIADNGYSREWPPHWIDIEVDGISSPVKVRCLLKDTYFTLYMMINQGKWSHTRSWRDYEDGYTLDGYQYHYWMGLKTMKKLNDIGHTTVVLETTFIYPPGNNNILQYRYENFTFSSASNGYKFDFSRAMPNKSGVYSDHVQHSSCLDSLRGAKFSTQDQDNDDDIKNCAVAAGVGWWFRGCDMVCNPLGLSYEVFPSARETSRYIKMAGLDYRLGVYAKQVGATMYFLVNLT